MLLCRNLSSIGLTILNTLNPDKPNHINIMFSMSKITVLLFALALAAVQGFVPVSQPRPNTELGAFFFGKPTETLAAKKKPVAKKAAAPVKKIVATKFEPTTARKAAAKKVDVEKPNPKLTIFPRTCHIN